MAPDTQTIDFDTICNAHALVLAAPFDSFISDPESERAVSETVSAAIKRVDLDDDDDNDEGEDDFDEEGEVEDEIEDEEDEDDEDDEDNDEDEDEYGDLDDEDEEEDDDVEPLSVRWRRAG
jgi:hypothetical protein